MGIHGLGIGFGFGLAFGWVLSVACMSMWTKR